MSTRSWIAMEEKESEEIKAIYCHFDGYLDGVGVTLMSYFDNEEDAKMIMKYGDRSSLPEHNEPEIKKEDLLRDSSYAESKGYKMDGTNELFTCERDMMHNIRGDIMIEYIYLWKDGKWNVSYLEMSNNEDAYNDYVSYHSKFKELQKEIDEQYSEKKESSK